jgi:hypothetical protein
VHFHGLLVNPPWRDFEELRKFLRSHWHLSPLTPWVGRMPPKQLLQRGPQYVLAYVKSPDKLLKGGGRGRPAGRAPQQKSHQQDYSDLPTEIRTFGMHVLEHARQQLERHMDGAQVEALVMSSRPTAPWWERIHVIRRLHHTPAPGGCRIPLRQKRRRLQSQSGVAVRRVRRGDTTTTLPGTAKAIPGRE